MNKARIIKNKMSPSLRKRVILVDQRSTTWAAVESFFEPVRRDIPSEPFVDDSSPHGKLSLLAWGVYIVILANKKGADVPVDPSQQRSLADALLTFPGLTAEARARLAVVRGIFAAYRDSDAVPGLSFVPSSVAGQISERMNEILDDAYLLEASHLRRLFGLRQNLASIRRDLRSLTRFIAKSRPWAKGITQVVSQTAFIGSDAVEEALQAIASLPSRRAPLCVDPRQHLHALGASAGEMLWTTWPVEDGLRIAWWNPEDEKWM